MSVIPACLTCAALFTAAANAVSGGPDYIGIAAVITAATGGFATVVMAVLAVIRYLRAGDPPTAEDIGEAVKKAIHEADG